MSAWRHILSTVEWLIVAGITIVLLLNTIWPVAAILFDRDSIVAGMEGISGFSPAPGSYTSKLFILYTVIWWAIVIAVLMAFLRGQSPSRIRDCAVAWMVSLISYSYLCLTLEMAGKWPFMIYVYYISSGERTFGTLNAPFWVWTAVVAIAVLFILNAKYSYERILFFILSFAVLSIILCIIFGEYEMYKDRDYVNYVGPLIYLMFKGTYTSLLYSLVSLVLSLGILKRLRRGKSVDLSGFNVIMAGEAPRGKGGGSGSV